MANVAEWSWLLAPVSSKRHVRPANGPVPRSGYGRLVALSNEPPGAA